MKGTKLRTTDYPQEARERLGSAVAAARTALGHKHRPSFAKAAGLSLRSLADIETGKPGVGEANLLAVARALPGWTEDTPREILEDAPAPEAAKPEAEGNVSQLTAEEVELIGRMSLDEIMANARMVQHTVSERAAVLWLRTAMQIKAQFEPDATPTTA